MDPELLARLLSILNPVSPAMAAPARAQEFEQPGPRLDLAAQAVPPPLPTMPSVGAPPQEAYRSVPMPAPVEDYRTQPAMPSLGASLAGPATGGGVPTPRPRPSEAPAAAPAPSQGDALLKTLQGVKAPPAPVAQKVSTPNLPALRPIQGGGIIELLASLGIGPQQAVQGMKLPGTLGQALGGR